jgi:hypothetical protein
MSNFGDEVLKDFEREANNKLKASGLSNVRVKAIKKSGNVEFEFYGPEDQVKRAQELL